MKEISISLKNNGPINLKITPDDISFNDILFDENNKNIEITKEVFFCRCGHSNNQPYCDGKHKKIGFDSNKEIEKEITQNYEGKDISIIFNRSICSGSAKCVHDFPNIYSSDSSDNWINPDASTIDEVIKSIKNCPSGALSYKLNTFSTKETYQDQTIKITKHGPLQIKGDIKLKNVIFSTNANFQKYTLCRCGASKNKPFCDYSHANINDENYTF